MLETNRPICASHTCSRGHLRLTALAMVFKLVEGAQKSWRHAQLPKLILGVKFGDGLEVVARKAAPQPAAAAA